MRIRSLGHLTLAPLALLLLSAPDAAAKRPKEKFATGEFTIDYQVSVERDASGLSLTGGTATLRPIGEGSLFIGKEGLRVQKLRMRVQGDLGVGAGGSMLVIDSSGSISPDDYIRMTDDSKVDLTNSTLTVRSGDFEIRDNASFFSAPGSQLTINGGNLTLHDSAKMSFTDSSLLVRGGDFKVFDTVNLSFDQAALRVQGGDVVFSESVDPTFTDSSIHVTGGNLIFSGSSTIRLSGSSLVVRGGDVLFSDSSTLVMRKSTVSGPGRDGRGCSAVLTDVAFLAAVATACPTTAFVRSEGGQLTAGCLKPDADQDKQCLGYYENTSPPRWQCEDKCLQTKDGMFCGKTDHF